MKSDLINNYISKYPAEYQKVLIKLKKEIKSVIPESTEAMVYGIPTFKINGKNIIHFAIYKNHIGIYPTPPTIEKFKKELLNYETTKGAIRFEINKKLPFDLIKKMVEYNKEIFTQI